MADLANIFRNHHQEYFQKYNAPSEVVRAIFDVEKCCTPAMGRSIVYVCQDCGAKEIRYQSCGNRNCPKCGHHKIGQWVANRMTEQLPVAYFMITFTLPHEFNILFKQYPKEAIKIFYDSVKNSLLEMGKNKLKGKLGFMMVYQSWTRKGDFHPHIHVMLPGGALSEDKNEWYFPAKRDFLFSERPLMALFRGKFNEQIWQFQESKKIPKNVYKKNFVVNIKKFDGVKNPFNYLAAYTQRGFLSNERIVGYDGENVTFEYKDSTTKKMCQRTLSAVDFMHLYLQHVLPKGVQRIRYGGFWAGAARKSLYAAKEILISHIEVSQEDIEETYVVLAENNFHIERTLKCSKCGGVMSIEPKWRSSA